MGDIKLFTISNGIASELIGASVAIEKTLHSLIETHLEQLLGIQFLASEFATGKNHGGRIDTLGIDENHSPVIIEYKRAINENVINQGLFYLDWLMDHRADFAFLVLKKMGQDVVDDIDWRAPRLLCIASDFTKYDEYAVPQIDRSISLIRYRRYDQNLLLLEQVNAKTARVSESATADAVFPKKLSKPGEKTVTDYLEQSPQNCATATNRCGYLWKHWAMMSK